MIENDGLHSANLYGKMACNRYIRMLAYIYSPVNSLRPRQNRRHFADAIFKCIFLNENVWISINISLKFVPKCLINNIPALVQIMAWRRPGDKPLSEPMMVNLLTHICATRPQWVKAVKYRWDLHVPSLRAYRSMDTDVNVAEFLRLLVNLTDANVKL